MCPVVYVGDEDSPPSADEDYDPSELIDEKALEADGVIVVSSKSEKGWSVVRSKVEEAPFRCTACGVRQVGIYGRLSRCCSDMVAEACMLVEARNGKPNMGRAMASRTEIM